MCKVLTINNYKITTPLINILNDVKLLSKGKLSSIKIRGDEISVTCPFHSNGQEKRPSCGIYIGDDESKYGIYNCFTCGSKGYFNHFIARCLNCSDQEASKWLVDNYGEESSEIGLELPIIDLSEKSIKSIDLSKNLSNMSDYHPYMTKRKLSPDICKRFDVKYDSKSQCIVFPVRDINENVVMYTKRSVNSKMFIIDKDTEKPIYLLYEIINKGITEVVVCESQINALYMWSLGYPAIATFGCNMSDYQFDLLNHCGIRHYILGFDGDDAGRHGTYKFIKNIRKDVFVDVLNIPEGKDLNDLSKEEVSLLMNSI